MDQDAEALERLYRERYRSFRDVLVGVVGSRELAREVVQEAFARALRERRRFRGEGSLEAWVWRICVNVALKMRQDLRRNWQLDEYEPAASDAATDHELRAAVRRLPPRRRLVVFLRYYADLSYAEIANAVGISEGTVAATLAQARGELQGLLAAEEVRS